jgi:hypothetical protein
MIFAEQFAHPCEVELGPVFPRRNDLGYVFLLRWLRLRFEVSWGAEVNVKVVLKVHRPSGVCEHFLVDTDPCDPEWNHHHRLTRDCFLHPYCDLLGPVTVVKFSYIVHFHGSSIPSEHDYVLVEGPRLGAGDAMRAPVDRRSAGLNTYRTREVDPSPLQRDTDWHNRHFDSLKLTPKFTKGTPDHPFHPKRYLHERIDEVIRDRTAHPERPQSIKVCVDCIDDTDFVNHLLHAQACGVHVQCLVDWRKMMLTTSPNYAHLKRSKVELLGVFAAQKHPLIEVDTDMHNKFVIFGDSHCLEGSFNISFDRWGANWESGMTFQSQGVCRLFDNIFQSVRGGVIQRYGIDPLSPFNLLYTFGRQTMLNGRPYRPHHAILAEIGRARRSIRACLFLINELRGEHGDSVIDALLHAKARGVDVQIILNGHLARQGDPGREYTMAEEIRRPLLPPVARLQRAGIPVALAYGQVDQPVPYCPLHSKYCIIDENIVLDGSFNWYNTSVYSHDMLVVAANPELARAYLHEFAQILRLFRFPNAVHGPFGAPAALLHHA